MSPVQGRSITGLESESAARTCLIAGPSVKHPREAPERKLSSFGFLRCGRKRNWRIRGGRARGRGGRGWLGGAIPWGIYSFIHSFNLLALAGQSGYSFSHSHDDAVLVVGV